ncbi:MAG: hypothetical protein AAFP85_09435 [Pseudomonadota bacterium]
MSEFLNFVFDHEVRPVGSDKTWYHQFDLDIHYDPYHNAELFTCVFLDARSLLDSYEKSKLEQGFWAMTGAGFDGNLNDIIWESSIAIGAKEKLISSMYYLYRDLFSQEPFGETCEMWWDALAYEINPMKRVDTINNTEHRRIQSAMFETLAKILDLDQHHCQFAALHGLNHVFHPETDDLIKNFVKSHPDLTDLEVEYATACANGRAM